MFNETPAVICKACPAQATHYIAKLANHTHLPGFRHHVYQAGHAQPTHCSDCAARVEAERNTRDLAKATPREQAIHAEWLAAQVRFAARAK